MGGPPSPRTGSPRTAGGAGRSPRRGNKHDEPDNDIPMLKFPQFEWYLGPMYKRYQEILAERAAANRVTVVRKKRSPSEVTPKFPHEKHTRPRPLGWKFSELAKEEKGSGTRDCSWTKQSWDHASVHLPNNRRTEAASPRRPSAVPAPWAYEVPRWPETTKAWQ